MGQRPGALLLRVYTGRHVVPSKPFTTDDLEINMKWKSFYKQYFDNIKEGVSKQNVVCPFHEDKDPSMSLDFETGLFYCHGCGKGGDVFSFHMLWHQCSFTVAKNAIMGNEQVDVLSQTEVDVAHLKLVASGELQKMLLIKRGWTLDIIKQLKLGWSNERVFIPIYNKDGKLCNIRKYDALHKSKNKFKGVKGYNTLRIWPEEALDLEQVIFFAGEPDTILARQMGLNGVTFCGGEGSFKASLLPLLAGKKVYIVYDVDTVGQNAGRQLAEKATEHATECYLCHLPASVLPANGDFTDLFHYCVDNDKQFTEEWGKVVSAAEKIEIKEKEKEIEHKNVDFYAAVQEKYFNKNIAMEAIAIGKNFSPFFAPKHLKITCSFAKGDSCKACKMFATGGEMDVEVDDENALDLIKCTSGEQRGKIKSLVGIVNCNQFELEVKTQTIEEVFISPVIDSERIDRQFVVRKIYVKGHNLQLNKTYRFSGKTIADAKTQEATHLFNEAVPELTDLDKFKLSEEEIGLLKIFNPKEVGVDGIEKQVASICRDISYNIPEIIVGRENLMFSYDLTFHSVLRFKFLGSRVEKGWVEMLALGDTRTGKTKVAVKMCRHYRVGEYITLESATLPGLVGGISQVGREVAFAWGVLPINDGRLVVLDEVNGLDARDIGNLSSIRDNGIAERTVVGSTRKTSARVRLIWISNPRSANLRIAHYSSGIESIKELMGRPEDIARLDLAIIVAKEDVAVEKINQLGHRKPEHKYTSDLCNKCLMWAWSRKEDDVFFTPEAERLILREAISLSEKYSDSIPLVQGSVQRIKLAKLATALACRLFSTNDGLKVTVKEEHVQYIVKFLQETYDSAYFGYNDYSFSKKEESTLTGTDEIRQAIENLGDSSMFVRKMLNSNQILFDDLVDFTGCNREFVKELRALMVSNNCLERKKSFYYKTKEFTKMLKEMQGRNKQ